MNHLSLPPIDSAQEPEEFGLIALIDIIIENRWLIAMITAAFVLLGALYAFLASPVYQADIMVQVEDSPDTSASKSLLGDVSALFEVKSTAAAEAQILGSRLVVTRAVDHLHAYITAKPKRFPVIGRLLARDSAAPAAPGVFGFGGYTWGGETIDVPLFDVPRKSEQEAFELKVLPDNAYELSGPGFDAGVRGRVGVREVFHGEQGDVTLLVDSLVGKPGAAFVLVRHSRLKTIQDIQDALNIQEKVKQSGVVIASLQDNDPVYVRDLMAQIGSQYVKQNIDRKAEDAAASLKFLDAQLPVLKRQLEASEQRLTRLRNERGTIDLEEEAKITLAQAADAKTKLLELVQKKDELLTHFNEGHPAVTAVNEQIATMQGQVDELSGKIKLLPNLQQDVLRLMLDVKVNTDLYTALLNNAQQLQLVKAGKVGNVRLVDVPALPEEPVKPKKSLVLAAAAVFGLLVAVGAAYARSMLFGGLSTPAQVEQHTGLNVYATIPYSKKQAEIVRRVLTRQSGKQLLVTEAPEDPAVESLRSLRTALQFAMFEAKNKLVLLTGPAPGVGKSFVSVNLGALLAAAGKRVLVVDCDIRKGYLHRYFGLKRGGGFAELITAQIDIDDALHRNVLPNLDFVSTGELPPNPAELLLSERVPETFRKLSERYDVVLMDSAPVLAATDAAVLAPLAGTVFLVALAGSTKAGELKESLKRLAQNGVMANGVLFNGISPNMGKYGFGSRYGGYRYMAYTYEGEKVR
ncbi:putative tyrosine-protein kinase EpsB [Burkholderia multivorans]